MRPTWSAASMLAALLIVVMTALTFVIYRVLGIIERRTPRELQGDWWAGFEREFRACAERAENSRRRDARRPGPPRPTNPG